MKKYTIGLVGARGYVGREFLALLAQDARFDLAYATSREYEGQRVGDVFNAVPYDIRFTRTEPAFVAGHGVDVVVLGLPNGFAHDYVKAIERETPGTVIVDLSADYRHQEGWVLGMADLWPAQIKGCTRIANPGCYATAAILALYPLRDLIAGSPSITGISGTSGAGTRASDKNDPRKTEGNIMPYAFSGHGHQAEISKAVGRPVRFLPHVAPFFRGLVTTICAPIKSGVPEAMVEARYCAAYKNSETVRLQKDPAQLKMVAGTKNAVIGGMAIDPASSTLAVSCALDNLLKGAASQALANVYLALGCGAPR